MDDPIDYQAVLADLKIRRETLDKIISNLEVVVGHGALTNYSSFSGSKSPEIHGDTFVGLNIPKGTAAYLKMTGKPARTTQEITDALNKGGLACSPGSVATILGRDFTRQEGEVVRASKGLWGLASWYPSRPKNVKRKEEEGEKSETEKS